MTANRMISNKVHGREATAPIKKDEVLDLWFGPKMFNRRGAEDFLKWNENKDKMDKWDATIGPVVAAGAEGKRVSSVEVDFRYDPSEKELEETSAQSEVMSWKRAIQFRTILETAGVLGKDEEFNPNIFEETYDNK